LALTKSHQYNFSLSITFLEKLRYIKHTEKPQDENTEILALNVEAETFIKHLIYIADEKNLEKIMEQIVKMDLDNKSMLRFLVEIESYVSNIILYIINNIHYKI